MARESWIAGAGRSHRELRTERVPQDVKAPSRSLASRPGRIETPPGLQAQVAFAILRDNLRLPSVVADDAHLDQQQR